MHTIKNVEYMEDYKLKLFFDDGKVKILDFENRLKEAKNMFLPLKNISYFKKVKCDGTTILWPNGLDLCPDVLYETSKETITKKTRVSRHQPKRAKQIRRSPIGLQK